MVPKSSAMWKQLFFDFLLILGPFWEPKSIFLEPKSAPNPIWEPFWQPKWSQNCPNFDLKGPQDGAKRDNRWKQRFLAAGGPPRTPIFRLWRRRRGPTWSQISTKIGPKMHPKIDDLFDPLFDRFWNPKWIKKRPPKWAKIDSTCVSSMSGF